MWPGWEIDPAPLFCFRVLILPISLCAWQILGDGCCHTMNRYGSYIYTQYHWVRLSLMVRCTSIQPRVIKLITGFSGHSLFVHILILSLCFMFDNLHSCNDIIRISLKRLFFVFIHEVQQSQTLNRRWYWDGSLNRWLDCNMWGSNNIALHWTKCDHQ